MAKKDKKKVREKEKLSLTPEQVIAGRLRNLANQEDLLSFLTRLLAMGLLLILLFGVVFGITPMENDDMKPRISAGDLMLYYRLEQNFRIDDVIVFEKDNKQYAGRIVAQGRDTVEITEEAQLKINGSVVWENDIYYSTPQYDSAVVYPVSLSDKQFFVLCDYREGARDSRYFGAVDLSEIKGKVITVIRRSGL